MSTQVYLVLEAAYGRVNGKNVKTGDLITLTEAQALYEIDLGKIRAAGVQSPPPVVVPEILSEDELLARRLGSARAFTIADLEVFLLTPGRPIAAALAALIGGGQSADTTAPTITTPAAQTVAENTPFSLTLTANEAVNWSKTGGADAALFTLIGPTLTMAGRDFEGPADANGDNAYVVQITAIDAAGNASSLTLTVTVSNVAEMPGVTPGGFDFSTPTNLVFLAALAA